MDWEGIAKGISALSPTALMILVLGGLLFWLFWKYIPKLQSSFEKSLAEAHKVNERQAQEFREAVANLQNSFLEALEKERQAHANAMQLAIASNVELGKSIDRLTTALITIQGAK